MKSQSLTRSNHIQGWWNIRRDTGSSVGLETSLVVGGVNCDSVVLQAESQFVSRRDL